MNYGNVKTLSMERADENTWGADALRYGMERAGDPLGQHDPRCGNDGLKSSRPDHNKLISTKCLREAPAEGCWRWLHLHRVEPQDVHRLKQRLRQRTGIRRGFPECRQVAQSSRRGMDDHAVGVGGRSVGAAGQL